jgi:MFS family permease
MVLDRWSRKRLLVVGLLGAAIALALYGLVRTAEQLIVVRLLHGLSAAVLSPGAFALLSDVAPPSRRARAMGAAGAFIALAAVLGPPLAGIGSDRFGPAVVFLSVACVLALAALIVAALARDVVSLPRAGSLSLASVPAVLAHPGLLVGYVAAFSLTVGIGTLVTHLPLVLEVRGDPARASGVAFSVYAVIALAGMAGPAAWLADRFGRRRPLAAGLAVVGIGLAALGAAQSMPAVYGAMAIFGVGFGVLFPAASALIADASAVHERGTAFGVFYAVYSLGVVAGSLLSGWLGESLGAASPAPFLAGAALALAASPCVLLAGRARTRTAATLEPAG